MSSDNSLSYIRALVDVVAITVLSGSDEQHKLRIKISSVSSKVWIPS
ncbi:MULTISPECIES: hypothetical protein [Yersinia]|nr:MULTISPECIES: hypothetical protein [Yersinia]